MAYILKKVTGGAGGGDATAANQSIQIDSAGTLNNYVSDSGTGYASVFKDSNLNSVFKNPSTNESIFNKSIISNNLSGTPMICVSFTAVTAAAVSTLLNAFLNSNNIYIVSLTSSQSAGSHDLFLLYANV